MEGEEGPDLLADVGGIPKPSCKEAAMAVATEKLLVVLRGWPLDCVAPVVVPQEAGAHCCGRRWELEEQ